MTKNQNGTIPLYEVCKKGNENIVRYLVKHISTEIYDNGYIEKHEYENIVKYLIDIGADVNQDGYYGNTPLTISTYYEQGVNIITQQLNNNYTILLIFLCRKDSYEDVETFSNENIEMIKLLINQGVDIN
ncbi:hypothetical protein LY90DRAFT_505555 [Neocallimastix californiae]|uniref:Uncharacterized protein n=1 Tax=Neocallimastix californiae TaxID=1754190 RepID=A0A1Y2DRE0_9FUNG|nr:hypothetical protein LY90DRAFT_505555 [Neocallimastix californiae]|eukprot:ORY61841.1 hypothetical protein LY90DRAFT_505555 [Neocallimastix californiae]